jgi:glucose/arabinose dehydrogenase
MRGHENDTLVRPLLRAAGLAIAGILVVLAGGVAAAPAPQSMAIRLAPIAASLDNPVAIAHAGDGSGRLFVIEQPGRIRIYDGAKLLPTPFLDIATLVNSNGNEQGLLGLAFDPNFTDNGFFYVDYTSKNGIGDTVVARYHVPAGTPNVADPASATPLLAIVQPEPNHNGGQLQFGPDGFLYISAGDGGGGGDQHGPIGNGQSLSTLLGKILRIDVRNQNTGDGLAYDIPATNPFVSTPNARAEIWAYGLRNPWRFSFDRATGDMFIGDVGQNSREEVDFWPAGSPSGVNYGWRCREGTQPYDMSTANCTSATFTPPILDYDHGGGRCSVTGGYRYRGHTFPQLDGVYIYADYCSGQIWGATPAGANWAPALLLDTGAFISTFGEDEAGELYLADRPSGQLFQVVGVDSERAFLPLIRR